MINTNLQARALFEVTTDTNAIISISATREVKKANLSPSHLLEQFTDLIIALLASEKEIRGIIYEGPFVDQPDVYQQLFKEAQEEDFLDRLQNILSQSVKILTAPIPIVSVISGAVNSIQMASICWAHHIIGTENTRIQFQDCTFGIFPGFGSTIYTSRRLLINDAAQLLIKGRPYAARQALASKLLDQTATDKAQAFNQAKTWILNNKVGQREKENSLTVEKDNEAQLMPFKKKSNLLFPGINPCFELILTSKKLSLEKSLELEAKMYKEVLSSPSSRSIMRTMHYGIKNAKIPTPQFETPVFDKIGIIGAGMMGSGIAFEVARAGINALLKDTDLALATKGKQYTEKTLDKQIALGRMTAEKKASMLSLIQPTDKVTDLASSDLIIEAVFEMEDLKARVISEAEPFLNPGGLFASNTTSLPISRLAMHSAHPENFIGMHFFSPVDRMPLVEIITGKQTSQQTVEKARAFALKLQKVPIIVHDSPAFFTSRIFFQYLLEAILMVLEGIPAQAIEQEATNAGFAISPLAVLDEISLPLMVHVYEQLPQLSSSQQRCYNYLKILIARQREGRKSGKGFYEYDSETGKKQIWQDTTIAVTAREPDRAVIQKRLLHAMALESFRCLNEGVLNQPIDGDIGAILGVGYAAHTGGPIAHIDQVGLDQFIQDCETFRIYGEHWTIPDSLRDLAKKEFKFYNGFESNWPPNSPEAQ